MRKPIEPKGDGMIRAVILKILENRGWVKYNEGAGPSMFSAPLHNLITENLVEMKVENGVTYLRAVRTDGAPPLKEEVQ